jgi:hypothetical protein
MGKLINFNEIKRNKEINGSIFLPQFITYQYINTTKSTHDNNKNINLDISPSFVSYYCVNTQSIPSMIHDNDIQDKSIYVGPPKNNKLIDFPIIQLKKYRGSNLL